MSSRKTELNLPNRREHHPAVPVAVPVAVTTGIRVAGIAVQVQGRPDVIRNTAVQAGHLIDIPNATRMTGTIGTTGIEVEETETDRISILTPQPLSTM